MEDINLYRSKLRSPNRCRPDAANGQWDGSIPSSSFGANAAFSSIRTFHTPNKNVNNGSNEMFSPHKSGYFLRTPSPLKKLRGNPSPSKLKSENPGTPSPQKAGSATDLFGNKSLLDNLDVPEDWDENFLSNFQDDWLFGLGFGNEDLDNLTKSPLKSPKRGLTFLNNTPKKFPANLSPFKSPLLTSSPKFYNSSPGDKTTPGGRPLTRQRKLFLQSPEHLVPHPPSTPPSAPLPGPIPFPPINDTSSSSMFSEGGLESSSIQSISTYLKNFDEEDHQDDSQVLPPAGWTSEENGQHVGKAPLTKQSKSKRGKAFTMLQSNFSGNVKAHPHNPSPVAITTTTTNHHQLQEQLNNSRKVKIEPQFTLLRPYAELHTNQISLRTTPVTPPNKIKISRDFSQIQTLPSKEQLRIVRSRFRDTLNKAVEQTIEKEKLKRGVSNPQPSPAPVVTATTTTTSLNPVNTNIIQQQQTPVQQVQRPPSIQPQIQQLQQPQQIQIQPQHIRAQIRLQPQLLHHPAHQAPVQISTFLPQCGITQFNLAAVNRPPPVKKRRR